MVVVIPAVFAAGFALTGSTGGALGWAGVGVVLGALALEVGRRGSLPLAAARPAEPSGADEIEVEAETAQRRPSEARGGLDGLYFKARNPSFLVVFGVTMVGLLPIGVFAVGIFTFVVAVQRGFYVQSLMPLAFGLLFAALAWHLLRAVVAQLWSGLIGRARGVWLTERGVVVRLDLRTIELTWTEIRNAWGTTVRLGRGLAPRVSVECRYITLADKQAYWGARGWWGRIALHTRDDVVATVAHTRLEHDLKLLRDGVNHYLDHPDDRAELRGDAEAAIARVEERRT